MLSHTMPNRAASSSSIKHTKPSWLPDHHEQMPASAAMHVYYPLSKADGEEWKLVK